MNQVDEVRWERMRPERFLQARREKPVVYLANGPLEWHGPHLPLGNDPLKANSYCLELARRIGGVVHPPLYLSTYSCNKENLPVRGEVEAQEIYEASLEHLFIFLARNEFRVIVFVIGHGGPGQRDIARRVADRVESKYVTRVLVLFDDDRRAYDPGAYGGDHAGGFETGMALVSFPELVDVDALPSLPTVLDMQELCIWSPERPDPRRDASCNDAELSREHILGWMGELVESTLQEMADAGTEMSSCLPEDVMRGAPLLESRDTLKARDFESSMSWEDFLKGARNHVELIREIYASEPVNLNLSIHRPLTLVVVAEDWSIATACNLPAWVRFFESYSNVEIRILKREHYRDLLPKKRKDGDPGIPRLFILGEGLETLASWGPNSQAFETALQGMRGCWEEQYPLICDWHRRDRGGSSLKEICDLIKRLL